MGSPDSLFLLFNAGAEECLTNFPNSPNTNCLSLVPMRKEEDGDKKSSGSKIVLQQSDQSSKLKLMFLKAVNLIAESTAKKKLSLAKCMLQVVPRTICSCPQLTSLDLSRNNLQTIPTCLATLPHLKTVDVRHNPLQLVPFSFRFSNGLKIAQHLADADRQKREPWKMFKCLLLGRRKSGKTTLLRSLTELQVHFLFLYTRVSFFLFSFFSRDFFKLPLFFSPFFFFLKRFYKTSFVFLSIFFFFR